jgi:rubrerythrin
MELGSVFLVLAVLVVVGVYLYAPFTRRARRLGTGDTHEISALQAERDRVINALQELDFDFKLGKIPAEDYPEQRAGLLKKGAEILRRLDELAPATSSGANAEARIEKAAAAKRADSSAEEAELDDDDIESMIAARRKQHKSKSAGFCPRCGKPVLVTDKFCPSCGKALT